MRTYVGKHERPLPPALGASRASGLGATGGASPTDRAQTAREASERVQAAYYRGRREA